MGYSFAVKFYGNGIVEFPVLMLPNPIDLFVSISAVIRFQEFSTYDELYVPAAQKINHHTLVTFDPLDNATLYSPGGKHPGREKMN